MYYLDSETSKAYEELKNENSYDNALKFVISFITHYSDEQGFYDYFSLFNGFVKVHYKGKFKKFIFQENRSDVAKHKIYFKANSLACVELPSKNSDEVQSFAKNRYEEIKKRAPKEIYKNMIAILKKYMDGYYDLNDIRVSIRPRWSYKIVIDNYFFD